MPDIVVEYKHARAGSEKRFLRVHPVTGVGSMDIESQASVFPTPQMAWEATVKAAEALRSKGAAKLPSWARLVCGIPLADGYSPADPYVCFNYLPKPKHADIAGVLTLCYIRSASQGWLGRVKTAKSQPQYEQGVGWTDNFAQAIAFTDPDHALATAALLPAVSDMNLFKALSVFVSVEPAPESKGSYDPLAAEISAVCEARDIQASLESSANERLREASVRPRAPGPRL